MKQNRHGYTGLTLVELLVVIAIIGILAALLIPVLGRAKARALVAPCLNNLRQINMAVRMYADDSSDAFPPATNSPPASFTAYTVLLKRYAGSVSSGQAKLFTCPADTFFYTNDDSGYVYHGLHEEVRFYNSSYAFNGGNFVIGNPPATRWPGIAGRKLSSIKDPSKTLLVLEFPALVPYSWHEPAGKSPVNDSKNVVSFVDGHASLVKMYWDATKPPNRIEAWQYEPPDDYGYKWSGD